MIYIDPPYNTGHDFVYKDCFGDTIQNYREQARLTDQSNADTSGRYHSAWCSMMYPRLKLARELLSDDGVILVSLDETESGNLRNMCDEIFGSNNLVVDFVWVKKDKTSGVPPKNMVLPNYEHVYVYEKESGLFSFRGQERSLKSYKQDENGRWWRTMPIQATGSQNNWFEIVDPISGRHKYGNWAFSEKSIKEMLADGRIRFPEKSDGLPVQIVYADEMKNQYSPLFANLGKYDSEVASKAFIRLFDNRKVFDFPKPISLLSFFVQQTTEENDIVLDFFSGSATTAHAVLNINVEENRNRKFIMVQLPEICSENSDAARAGYANICEIGEDRIRRAGNAIKVEFAESIHQLKLHEESKQLPDIGFRVFKLDESGIEKPGPGRLVLDVVKPDRLDLDIVFEMMLKWGLELTLPVEQEEMAGYPCYSVAYGELVCCLAPGLTTDALEAIAEIEPRRVLMLDRILDDSLKLNAVQIFKRVEERTGREVELRTV